MGTSDRLPFVALAEEMKNRGIDIGLLCYVWRNPETVLTRERVQEVIVGVEHAVSPGFSSR